MTNAIHFQTFTLPGLRMHAALAGPEAGPLVVMLHGFPQFWYSWRRPMEILAEAGYRVVAPDQRGYNLTDKTPPYDIGTLTGDIVNLIQANGRESAFVAGHDWGAGVAWALAAAHPERVQRLAILNVPHPAVISRALLGGNLRQMRRSYYIGAFQIPWLPERLLSSDNYKPLWRAMRNSARRGTFTEDDREKYVAAWSQPGALSAMIGWYRAMFKAVEPGTRRRYARRIQMPTLILWGEQDIALGVELAEESVNWLENGRLIRYPDNTHWIVDELADEVAAQLKAHFGG